MAAAASQTPNAVTVDGEISKPANVWTKPPKMEINVPEFIEKAKQRLEHITETGLIVDLPKLEEIQKRCLTLFVVDRKTRKVIRASSDIIINLLATVGSRPLRVIKCKGYMTWSALFNSPEECLNISQKEVITQSYILRSEYMGKRRSTVAVHHVPHYVDGEHLGAFFLKYGEMVHIEVDELHGVWSFDISTRHRRIT